jgi:O-acetyl-ADP-ribose deacetylase (regulator of RNase III)
MKKSKEMVMMQTFKEGRIRIIQDDITKAEVDAIVNAANYELIPGGGVDGAIHRAAGPKLAIAAKNFGFLEPGKVIITKGFDLKAKYVIHTVGPIWSNHDPLKYSQREVLRSCYQSIYDVLKMNRLTTVAIPNIATGVYGFPPPLAGHIALEVTLKFLEEEKFQGRIDFYCYEEFNYQIYVETLKKMGLS